MEFKKLHNITLVHMKTFDVTFSPFIWGHYKFVTFLSFLVFFFSWKNWFECQIVLVLLIQFPNRILNFRLLLFAYVVANHFIFICPVISSNSKYSELPNKRAGQNKQVTREDFFSFIAWKMRVWWKLFSFVTWKIENMVDYNMIMYFSF